MAVTGMKNMVSVLVGTMSVTEATEFIFAGYYPEGAVAAFTEFRIFGKLAGIGRG
jgi:hypothetical protein